MVVTPSRQLIGFALMAISLLGCGSQQCKSAKCYFDKALKQEDTAAERAILNYRSALQREPTMGEAWYRLALTEAKLNRSASAYASFGESLRLKVHEKECRIAMAEFDLMSHKSGGEVARLARNRILESMPVLAALSGGAYDAERILGHLALADKETDKALDHFKTADRISPGQPPLTMAIIQTRLIRGERAEARQLADQLAAHAPDFEPVQAVLYSMNIDDGKYEKAEAILETLARTAPRDDPSALLRLYRHYRQYGPTAKMQRTEQQVLTAYPKSPKVDETLGDVAKEYGEPSSALKYFMAAQSLDPANWAIYEKKIASTLVALRRVSDALPRIEGLIKRDSNDRDARLLRAMLLLELNRPGDLDQSIEELRRLKGLSPNSANYRFHLGRALVAKEEFAGARQEFQTSLQLDSEFEPSLLALASLCLRNHDFTSAKLHSEQAIKKNPLSLDAQLIHAASLVGLNRLNEAEQELLVLKAHGSNTINIDLQLGTLYALQHRTAESLQLLRSLYRPANGEFRAAEGIIEALLLEGKADRALAFIADEATKHSEVQQLQILLARTYGRTGFIKEASAAYQQLSTTIPFESALAIGNLRLQSGDTREAISSLSLAVKLNAAHPLVYALLGRAFGLEGNQKASLEAYQRSFALDPRNASVANNLAVLLLESPADLDEAARLATFANRQSPGRREFEDTLGMVYLRQNRANEARELFSALVRKHPAEVNYRQHLASALSALGASDLARIELEKARGLAVDPGVKPSVHESRSSR